MDISIKIYLAVLGSYSKIYAVFLSNISLYFLHKFI